jgi:hypothetical protein
MRIRKGNNIHLYLDGKEVTHIISDEAKWHVESEYDNVISEPKFSIEGRTNLTEELFHNTVSELLNKRYTTVGARSSKGRSMLMGNPALQEQSQIRYFKSQHIPTYVRYTKGLKPDVPKENDGLNWRKRYNN